MMGVEQLVRARLYVQPSVILESLRTIVDRDRGIHVWMPLSEQFHHQILAKGVGEAAGLVDEPLPL